MGFFALAMDIIMNLFNPFSVAFPNQPHTFHINSFGSLDGLAFIFFVIPFYHRRECLFSFDCVGFLNNNPSSKCVDSIAFAGNSMLSIRNWSLTRTNFQQKFSIIDFLLQLFIYF